ncbi:nuclear transport factor 2 family protein [Bacteroidota bacterium]
MNQEKNKSDILSVVKAHNKAWSIDENIDKQMKFIHPNIQFIAPPYKKIISGEKEYKDSYLDWMKHAKVHHFNELNPEITIFKDRKTAFVTYHIEMSFDFDSVKVDNWQGIDFMTLVNEDGNWKIISDMYAKMEE